MESDEDYQSFSPPEEPSPPVHRRLKRLKKSVQVSNPSSTELVKEDPLMSTIDPVKSIAKESSESLGSEAERDPGSDIREDESVGEMPNLNAEIQEEARSGSPTEGSDVGSGSNPEIDGLNLGGNSGETKKSLNSDDTGDEFDGNTASQDAVVEKNVGLLKMEKSEKKRLNKENSEEKKNKRAKNSAGEAKMKASSSSRKREEKERKIHLQQLHAESQRLLRETRDATFKPVPVVKKPISSVLEKIRQRKAELLKRTASLSTNSSSRDSETNHVVEDASPKEMELGDSVDGTEKETAESSPAEERSLDVSSMEGPKEGASQQRHENIPSQMVLEEQPTNEFRAPVDDTQDLFSDDTLASEEKDEPSNHQDYSQQEEVLAPSVLAMDLKFDSAPCDDIDDEDNDKENSDPDRAAAEFSPPRGDPVKAFVDDEAVEEDDSDNDLLRFQENEDDEGNEDFEDLNDLIATEFEEKPSDNERRNELHQKWLEQQDAAGTDNLLQRLNCGSKLKETSLFEDEEEEDSDLEKCGEESDDDGGEDPAKTSLVGINSEKAKEMIHQMFSDKTDGYVSSDGEEAEQRLIKQQILGKAVDKGSLLSPAKDERASEVFGLIKKLNIVPEAKKKAKTSFFEKTLLVANTNTFYKSSFLGRATSHSLPSSHKQGTSKVRSYIFGRDDSNSRNSISMSEDSCDAVNELPQNSQENKRTVKSAVHKFSSSQSKTSSSTQSGRSATTETVTGVSLFEMLKRSSEHSNACNEDNIVGLSQTLIASFRVPKKPVKIEGRTS